MEFDLGRIDWTTLAAIATAILAGMTWWLAKGARAEAQASTNAILEMRQDRETSVRPYLAWRAAGSPIRAVGANIGRGAAINAVFFWIDPKGRALKTKHRLAVQAGQEFSETFQFELEQTTTTETPPGVESRRIDGSDTLVAFCEDQLGNRFEFTGPDMNIWRPGEKQLPWHDWHERVISAVDKTVEG
jgi:cbb3-type cytochrome oxidase subunit 3